ncbi:MAG: putative sugar O-methyltransferase [Bacteroidetes bacterium]|nr:putative sugar O-methyltransferase [Bacteroidota bacterium]
MNFHDRIIKSFKLCIEDDSNKYRSLHWEKRLANSSPEEWGAVNKFENFRSVESQLSVGMDHAGALSETESAFRRLKTIIGIDKICMLSETEIGNPLVHKVSPNFTTNLNDLDLIYFCEKINRFLKGQPSIVCEIGGGYGGLISKVSTIYPKTTMVLFDLPEAGMLQSYYLTQLYPNKSFFFYQDYKGLESSEYFTYDFLKRYDFIILPPWLAEKLADDVIDLYINTRSMMEMKTETIKYYFDIIHRSVKSNGFFYCVNRYEKSTVGYPIRIAEYPFDNFWNILESEPFCRSPHIHELFLKRTGRYSRAMAECLAQLPTETPTMSNKNKLLKKIKLFFSGVKY